MCVKTEVGKHVERQSIAVDEGVRRHEEGRRQQRDPDIERVST